MYLRRGRSFCSSGAPKWLALLFYDIPFVLRGGKVILSRLENGCFPKSHIRRRGRHVLIILFATNRSCNVDLHTCTESSACPRRGAPVLAADRSLSSAPLVISCVDKLSPSAGYIQGCRFQFSPSRTIMPLRQETRQEDRQMLWLKIYPSITRFQGWPKTLHQGACRVS